MYETLFGFHRQPFQVCDGKNSFFASESARQVIPQLSHAMRTDLGIAVLTGPSGCGKTTLLRHLRLLLSSNGRVLVCSAAGLTSPTELLQTIWFAALQTAGQSEVVSESAAAVPRELASRWNVRQRLQKSTDLWGPVILLIDDAHLLSVPVLNEIRAFSEELTDGRQLVRCLIAGPLALEEELARASHADFSGRIRCHTFLQPLTMRESVEYLAQQIQSVGGDLGRLFSSEAVNRIVAAADGSPRAINLLADESLLVSAEREKAYVDLDCVKHAFNKLQHLPCAWGISRDDSDAGHDEQPRSVVAQSGTAELNLSGSATPFGSVTPSEAADTKTASMIEFGQIPAPEDMLDPTTAISVESSKSKTPQQSGNLRAMALRDTAAGFEFSAPGVIEIGAPSPLSRAQKAASNSNSGVAKPALDQASNVPVVDMPVVDMPVVDVSGSSESVFEMTATSQQGPDAEGSSSTKLPVDLDDQLHDDTDGNFQDVFPTGQLDVQQSMHDAGAQSAQSRWLPSTPNAAGEMTDSNPAGLNPSSVDEKLEQISAQGKRTRAAAKDDLDGRALSNRRPVFDRYTWVELGREVPFGQSSATSARYRDAACSEADAFAFTDPPMGMDVIPVTLCSDAEIVASLETSVDDSMSGTFFVLPKELRSRDLSNPWQRADSEADLHVLSDSLEIDGLLNEEDQPEVQDVVTGDSIDAEFGAEAQLVEPDTKPFVSPLQRWRDGQLVTSIELPAAVPPIEPEENEAEAAATIPFRKEVPAAAVYESPTAQIESSKAADATAREVEESELSDHQSDMNSDKQVRFFTLPGVASELHGQSVRQFVDEETDALVDSIAELQDDVHGFHVPDAGTTAGTYEGGDNSNEPARLPAAGTAIDSADAASALNSGYRPGMLLKQAIQRVAEQGQLPRERSVVQTTDANSLPFAAELGDATNHSADKDVANHGTESIQESHNTTKQKSRFSDLFTRLQQARRSGS